MTLAHGRKSSIRRSMVLGALAGAGLMFAATSAFAQGGCDPEDLHDSASEYLAAQASGDATKMHMNLWVNYNEQMENATMSTGVLSKPMKPDFERTLYDTTSCTAYIEQVYTDPAHPYVIGTIVQTGQGNVSGIQMVYTDKKNGWLFNPANTKKYSEAENWGEIPAADRDSRATLQAAADAYLNLFNDKNVQVPWGTPCARLEGGAYTSKAAPGQPLAATDSCNVGVPSGVPIVDRTYVIDVPHGAVAVLSHFGKDQEPDFHVFRIEHGKLKFVHTITACVKVANCGLKPSPQVQAKLGN
jgi:hypothetical protein